jgi:hypothetical protein
MGRLLVIVVLMVIVITSIILQSNYRKTSEITPELFTNYHSKQARNLATYALNYGIQQLVAGNVESLPFSSTTAINVTDGTINQIQYAAVEGEDDIIVVSAQITWNGDASNPITYQSSAIFKYVEGNSGSPWSDIFERVTVLKGDWEFGNPHCGFDCVTGEPMRNVRDLVFQNIFGITLAEFRARADAWPAGRNPHFTGGLYYKRGDVDIQGNPKDLGNGIVVVEGDWSQQSGTNFQGILIVIGHTNIQTPHEDFQGTVIGLGENASGISLRLQANVTLHYTLETRQFIRNLLAANNLSWNTDSAGGGGGNSSEPTYELVKWLE